MCSFMTLIAQCMFASNVLHCIHVNNDHLHTHLVTIYDKYHETMLFCPSLKEEGIDKPGTGSGSDWGPNPGHVVAWYNQSSMVNEHW